MEAEFGGIHLVEGDHLMLRAWHGISPGFRAAALWLPASLAQQWSTDGEVRRNESDAPDFVRAEGIRSHVGIPLVAVAEGATERLGVLMLASRREDAFRPEELRILMSIAGQLSLAIHHARLVDRLRTEARVNAALLELETAINRERTEEGVANAVMRATPRLATVSMGVILLRNETTGDVAPVAFEPPASEATRAELARRPEPYAQRPVVRDILRDGRSVYVPDIRKDPDASGLRWKEFGVLSAFFVPLQAGSEIFGLLAVGGQLPHAYSPHEIELFKGVAQRAAQAIQSLRSRAAAGRLFEEREAAHEELRRTQSQVLQQERLRSLGQMAAGIVHDINNALSPITGYTELLLMTETGLPSHVRDYLATIRTAGQDIAQIVARMRDFYRQRDEQEPLAQLSLNQVVKQVVQLTRPRWKDMPQQRGVTIEVCIELDEQLPRVLGAEHEIREALTNLIINAVDAMPKGGRITLRTTPHDGHAALEVVDTGVGMDETTRERCLEPFFTTKGEQGTGLGLAMVYGTMRRHNGTIEIESAQGRGSTFRLRFPGGTGAASAGSIRRSPAAAHRSLRILAVDDEPLVRKLVHDALVSDGHELTLADGGEAAIRALSSASTPFDVVVTDLGMPVADGRKVIEVARAVSPSTGVVLLTGWGGRHHAEGDLPAVEAIVGKPPRIAELRAAVLKAVLREKP